MRRMLATALAALLVVGVSGPSLAGTSAGSQHAATQHTDKAKPKPKHKKKPTKKAKPKTHPLPPAQLLTINDPTGDANGINDQAGAIGAVSGQFVGNQSTPVDDPAGDITSVVFARLDDGHTVRGFTVTLTLSATPSVGHAYLVNFAIGTCTIWNVQWASDPVDGTGGGLANQCGSNPAVPTSFTVPVAVKGNTIVWTLPAGTGGGALSLGARISAITAQSFLATPAVVVVSEDSTAPNAEAYTIGQ